MLSLHPAEASYSAIDEGINVYEKTSHTPCSRRGACRLDAHRPGNSRHSQRDRLKSEGRRLLYAVVGLRHAAAETRLERVHPPDLLLGGAVNHAAVLQSLRRIVRFDDV